LGLIIPIVRSVGPTYIEAARKKPMSENYKHWMTCPGCKTESYVPVIADGEQFRCSNQDCERVFQVFIHGGNVTIFRTIYPEYYLNARTIHKELNDE